MNKIKDLILNVAFIEFWKNGYSGISFNDIIKLTQLSKGGVYHHFSSKRDLALQVIENKVKNWHEKTWLSPLNLHRNPIKGLSKSIKLFLAEENLILGSPLSIFDNAEDEMKKNIFGIYEIWENSIQNKLEYGIKRKLINSDIDSKEFSRHFICNIEGTLAISKNTKNPKYIKKSLNSLLSYTQSLASQ